MKHKTDPARRIRNADNLCGCLEAVRVGLWWGAVLATATTPRPAFCLQGPSVNVPVAAQKSADVVADSSAPGGRRSSAESVNSVAFSSTILAKRSGL